MQKMRTVATDLILFNFEFLYKRYSVLVFAAERQVKNNALL